MGGFYSVNPRVRKGIARLPSPRCVDAYDPASEGYAERHISYETQLPNGLLRVDIGEPIKRLPDEAQAVPQGKPSAAPVAAPAAPAVAPSVAPAEPAGSPKDHRAITRNP